MKDVYNPVTGTTASADVPVVDDRSSPTGHAIPPRYTHESMQYQPVTERDFNENRPQEQLPPLRMRRLSHPGFNVPMELPVPTLEVVVPDPRGEPPRSLERPAQSDATITQSKVQEEDYVKSKPQHRSAGDE